MYGINGFGEGNRLKIFNGYYFIGEFEFDEEDDDDEQKLLEWLILTDKLFFIILQIIWKNRNMKIELNQ